MNINSIDRAIQNDFCESFLSSFSSTQKKIMIVALGIFSAVALAYYFFRFCNFKANPLITDKRLETNINVQVTEGSEEVQATEDSKDHFDIFLKIPTGKIFPLSISCDETIADIKAFINKQEGFDIDRQKVIWKGKRLEDHQSMKDLGIKINDTIHIVVSMCM
jgi:hypothetical protein